MKSKDLKIGNYLFLDDDIISEVSRINADDTIQVWNFDKSGSLGCFGVNEFDPIPITKELLIRFGFEDGMEEMGYDAGEVFIYYHKWSNYFEINGDKYFIKELHRLQNLIYEMFRIELKFKD